jgi:DNA-binding beta-propeller fold protein YncE
LTLCLSAAIGAAAAEPPVDYDKLRVGPTTEGRIVVPTNQILSPRGRQVVLDNRPTDVALSPDGRWLGVLGNNQVYLIDPVAGKLVAQASHEGGSFTGIVFTPDGRRLLASSALGTVNSWAVQGDGHLQLQDPIKLPPRQDRPLSQSGGVVAPADKLRHSVVPAGLAVAPDGAALWVVFNVDNALAQIDLASRALLQRIPVGNAPYGVVLRGDTAYVSNWAGRRPNSGDVVGPSGDAPPVRVDPLRHIACDGSISVVDLKAGRQRAEILVGQHPCGLALSPDSRLLVVANANSDSISVIETHSERVIETISTRPDKSLLFGSAPNAVAFGPDGATLYVSNGANNAVAVIELAPPQSKLLGCVPTGWYPAGLVVDSARRALYVANVKGVGSRSGNAYQRHTAAQRLKAQSPPAPPASQESREIAYSSYDFQGTLSLMPLPGREELQVATQTVLENNRQSEAASALAPPRPDATAIPLPQRHGEPSLFKHVLYIIKENRTYDQVLGDVARGAGDPRLCIFGRRVTPNQHKLVDEFVLLDNFYCSGVLSADGHQWTDEAYVTDYLEKAFGAFPRSYPHDGDDAMAYAGSGFLWDNALARGRTLRVYGEFVKATLHWKDPERRPAPKFADVYRDFLDHSGKIDVRTRATIETLEPHFCRQWPGFLLTVPDVYRAAQFIRELGQWERSGTMPNLMIMDLPCNHTSGTKPSFPTPQAAVADNDLALGQIVEAVSHSRFWPETCIFVVEDDPQNGFDHVDGHRTVALVVSPYTRRRVVDSTNYNQTSLVRTIELILGLPPMNQFDASASAMSSCFTPQANLTPYRAEKNLVPLDQLNPEVSEIRDPRQRHWAEVSLQLPLDEADKADEDTLNRILWFATRGNDESYPAWAVRPDDDDDR